MGDHTNISLRRISVLLASLLILTILSIQAAVTFRLLYPPRAFTGLAPLRKFCAPYLWPIVV